MHHVLLLLLLTAVMPYLLSLFCLYLYFHGLRPSLLCFVFLEVLGLFFFSCPVSC
ncbi:hypothetical protein C2G38_2062924 [Gigaspora rosea]|uniref:Uncharacterized protein n=1 Tax=Gigaspora rosea TaxID=44941 RepID=A0A397W1G7_9GLOM|nr:hypothetical protein C2G38_2062924 [Gigaspora rosea]